MDQFLFIKTPTGLAPACEEAKEWLGKKKLGATILVEPHEMRNGPFFRKWFSLVEMAFDYWREDAATIEYKGAAVLPNFERFRKDVTILAGFYHPVVNLKGEVRLEADSLKWSRMSEDTFNKLYDATIQVLLSKVFNGKVCRTMTEAELRGVAEQVMSYAA